jgi:hypothetical protein
MYNEDDEYNETAATNMLREIRRGSVPQHFCGRQGYPRDASDIDRWARTNEELAALLVEAKIIGAESLMNQCLLISDSMEYRADSKKVMMDSRLKLAAVWNPEKYGAKSDKNITINNNVVDWSKHENREAFGCND